MKITKNRSLKRAVRIALGLTFIFTGVLHFVAAGKFMEIMPPVLPWHLALVYISGVFEILGGIGFIAERTKRGAGIGLILLLIAVYPANIYAAMYQVQVGGFMNSPVYHWIRLPMQFVLIALVWWCGDIRNKGEGNEA
jgi:uncharacterized membrane protein